MSVSEPFIRRPVATTLLTVAVALAGAVAYVFLPVSPLPQVEFPTISVTASLPGASPETMASSVATPLERQFGRIAGITEMTSSSYLGVTSVTLQFDLSRNIDAAARDVQAAINAARGQLPTNLPNNPTYRKVNPADAPIMILAMTSDTYDRGKMYDVAASILQQKLSQVSGVGQVVVGGGALPAVRVEVNPTLLNNLGLGLDDVRNALAAANVNRPKGAIVGEDRTWSITTTDQITKASEYRPMVISFRNGAAIRLADVATVRDSVEDIRTSGLSDAKPSISLIISRQPGANIIDTVDRIRTLLPQFQAEIPAGIKLGVAMDRTTTIRASVRDVELTLVLSIGLVILVVFLFLRDLRSTLIPSVAVPISLIGTFGVMYLFGYSIDNLSLMALTIATGFVVDDAIVVVENVTRYLEKGMPPFQAAIKGAREIGFTVLSISVSLIAVFIPILLMSGIMGRLFREFAVTLSVAIAVSMVISLTTTPMMCALLLRKHDEDRTRGWFYRVSERAFDGVHRFYELTLGWVLRHPLLMLFVTLLTIALTIYLYIAIPKGFFPQQDTGRLSGSLQADQNTSFQSMSRLLVQYATAVGDDPAVKNVIAFTGGGGGGGSTVNTGRMFVDLKPLDDRKVSADEVIGRLRGKLARIPGAGLVLQSVQDVRTGGRMSRALYQYTMQGDNFAELSEWAPKILERLSTRIPGLLDVSSDQQNNGLQAGLVIDRETARRLGVTTQAIDSTLYDLFGQRQVSTYYLQLNQYHVVMTADQKLLQNPDGLKYVYVKSDSGKQVPLASIAHFGTSTTALSVNHQGQFPAVTFSFNLKPGFSLGDAVNEIQKAEQEMGLPDTMHGSFAGTAKEFEAARAGQVWLILSALATVYIVLGILYESYVHPITILSTLPSAGVGALLALMLFGQDLNVIALIGIILLIGIVKKNAIMMIDFALEAERSGNVSPTEAIYKAALLRFRPITMTTMAALLGGLPLALGGGTGAELRRPLGIAIVGGLIFSQMLTLYTTPVIYLYLDRLRLAVLRFQHRGAHVGPRDAPAKSILPGTVRLLCFLPFAFLLGSASCSVGPDYRRPQLQTPIRYSSITGDEMTAPPLGADWWTMFGDPMLTNLEESAMKANLGLKAAVARVAQARAAARVVESDFFPVITFDPSIERARTPANTGRSSGGVIVTPGGGTAVSSGRRARTFTDVRVPFDLTYEIDVWGRVRRSFEASTAQARAAESDYLVVIQTLQADVAQNYFNIRALDLQDDIFQKTVQTFRDQVRLTRTQYDAGLVSQLDVLQAEAQLASTLSQQLDVRRQRADAEHALAILLGRSPGELSVPHDALTTEPPVVPVGLPADLLRRRPDVAQAEQNLIAANAQVGVATADFYPRFQLTGAAGFESIDIEHALDWQQRVWSIGPSVSVPLFEGGRLTASLKQARARYDEVHANYRSSVVTAIRDVEDSLTDLHQRTNQARALKQAVDSSREYRRLSELQWRRGLTSYLQVIDAERTLLNNELSAAQVANQRLAATILLIKSLGGGWDPEPAATQPYSAPSEKGVGP